MGNGCAIYKRNRRKDERQVSCPVIYAERLTNRHEMKEAKVLFLGAAESGKSTLCRQIRILHGYKFSDEEIRHFKHYIRFSCLEHLITIIEDYLGDKEYQGIHGDKDMVEFLEQYKVKKDFERSYLNKAITIWRISALQKFMLASVRPMGIPSIVPPKRLHADNPASHFLPSLSRILAKGYNPTMEDILSVRIPTSGIVETTLTRSGISISLIDVGGQRSERKKWLHCFDEVSAVVFVVAMSEYDEDLAEDKKINRMHESIKLFHTICSIKWFLNSPIVLFLNKKDVFDEKIVYSPLNKCFPEYTGGDNKQVASKYIWEQFCKERSASRQLYLHYTCAKDTKNIHVVFDVMVDTILLKNINEVCFL